MDLEKIIPPKKDSVDEIHEYLKDLVKKATGGFVNPLINFILPSFHQKRFEIWCTEVYKVIIELEENKLSISNLNENYEFVSLLKECILIASRNHQEEKLNALKGILINSINSEISFDVMMICTKFIDSLTVSHILILKKIKENISEVEWLLDFNEIIKKLNLIQIDLNFDYSIIKVLINDLHKLGLIVISNKIELDKDVVRNTIGLALLGENKSLPYIVITDLGISFMEYIRNK
jgi:hypothetical protein